MKSKLSNRFLFVSTIICCLAALPTASTATSLYWDTNGTGADGSGAATGNWGTSAFWSTDSTGNDVDGPLTLIAGTTNADDLFFSAGTNGTGGTVTVTTPQFAHSVTFDDPVNLTFSLAAAPNNTGNMTLGNTSADVGIFVTANGANTINTPIVLNNGGTPVTFSNSGTSLQTLTGVISGASPLVVNSSGTGPILLSGTNTFNGGLTLQAGTLVLNNNGAAGTGAFVLAGGTLDSTSGPTLSIANTWNADSAFGASQSVVNGAAAVRNTTLSGAATLSANRIITVNSNTGLAQSAGNFNALTVSGVVGGAFSLTKAGAGTLSLSNTSNTFSGGAIVTGGALRLAGADSALQDNNVSLNGGVIEFNYAPAASYTLGTGIGQINFTGDGGFSAIGGARSVTLNAGAALTWGTTSNFVGNGKALKFSSLTSNNTLTLTNAIDLGAATRTIDVTIGTGVGGADAVLSGAITNGSITKTGTGTLALTNAASALSGTTTISGGALALVGVSNANTNILLNGGMYRLAGDFTAALGTGNGQIAFAGGAADGGFSADVTAARTVNIGGAGATLTWNSTPNFLGTGALLLGCMASNQTTILANGLDFNGADRRINVDDGNTGDEARIEGVISGAGALIKTGGSIGGGGRLVLTGANTYTGQTIIRNGQILVNSSVLNNTPSPLGNSAASILLGDASSLSSDGTSNSLVQLFFRGTNTAGVATVAGDSQSFQIDRPIITSSNTATVLGRARIGLSGNGGSGLDTNKLTLAGDLTAGRGTELWCERNGQTIEVTGNITGNGQIYLHGNVNAGLNQDGRANGNFRLSDLARPYTGALTVTLGSLTIAGSVPLTGPSPHGTQGLNLGDGNGGNTLNSNGRDATRAVYLETPGATYERVINPGQGSAVTPSTTTGTPIQSTLYGTGAVNLMNGHRFGGVNTTGTVTFSGNIAPNGVAVSVTGTAGHNSLGSTNPISIVHNIALMAATGGTVDFTGAISGATLPTFPGSASAGGSNAAGNNTRITINQFRNHPNLDGNFDGIADPGVANALVGTPLGGTVVMSGTNSYGSTTEILGGTLRLNYGTNNTSKLADGAALILSGGTLELVDGTSAAEVVGSTTINGPSTITSSGSKVINLGAITRNSGGSVNFTAENIAKTSNANDASGVLGSWATINNTDLAANDGSGNIVKYTAYTDYTRGNSGTQIIADNSAHNVRIIQGSGTPGPLTLGAATTAINTLTQSDSGGTGAATIDPAGQTLRTNSILVQATAGGLTLGTGTLTAASAGGDLSLQNFSASPLTINSVIANNTGASSLSVGGSGTTILTGTNTHTGVTTIASGTLQVGDGTTDGSLATSAGIVNNGALVYNIVDPQTFAGVISGYGSLTKSGAGSLTLTGTNTFTGTTTISGGSIQLGTGAGGGTTGTLSTTGTLVNNGELIINRSNNTAQGTDFANVVSGTGSITKTGTGTLTLNGINTYDGTTTITQGVLSITHASALGSAVGNTVINSNGKIDATGGGQLSISGGITLAENITIQGTGDAAPYTRAINSNSGTNTLTGTLTLTGTAGFRIGPNAGTLNLGLIQRSAGGGGIIFDPNGATSIVNVNTAIDNNGGDLTIHAGGIAVLAAANNDIGNTIIQNGSTLKTTIASALPAARNVTLGQGVGNTSVGLNNDVGTLFLETGDETINALVGVRNAANSAPASSRKITSSTAGLKTLTLGNGNGSATFDGLIENGSGGGTMALTKTGTGTQTLTSPQTYTGDTTINNGTLTLASVAAINALASSQSGNTNSNNSLTGLTDTSGLVPGQTVTGTGIPADTYVIAVPNATTVTISKNATATATGVTLNFGAYSVPARAGALADAGTVRINGVGSRLSLATDINDTVNTLFLDGIPAAAGTWGSTASTATNQNDDFFSGEGILTVTTTGVANDYATWDNEYAADLSNKAGDNDGDGLNNFKEYAFGLNPTSGSSVNPISQGLNKTTGVFKYTRRAGITGVTYTYESSTTLSGWASFTPTSATTNGATPVEEITVTVPGAPLADPKFFIRVQASQP